MGALAGWVDTGPVVSRRNGRQLAAMGHYAVNTWDLLRIPPAPAPVDTVSGEFRTGTVILAR